MALREDQLQDFYEDCYTPTPGGEKHARWRELGAVGKAGHVVSLAARAGCSAPRVVAEVGCGDGAVLAELGRRGFGARRVGFEISSTGADLAGRRAEVDEAHVFDGARLPAEEGAYDVVFATHVLEHVPDPLPLTRELLRVGRVVVIEVPLEDNLSARRPAARAASEGVGHLQRFSRRQIRRLVAGAGGQVRGELLDPLPLEVHRFGAVTPSQHARGVAKWAVRRALAVVPAVGERAITMHYAVAATPLGDR